jgi:hypothetical protein
MKIDEVQDVELMVCIQNTENFGIVVEAVGLVVEVVGLVVVVVEFVVEVGN